MRPVILHLEDHVILAEAVALGFRHLGFHGEIINAETVEDAMRIIRKRKENNQDIDLVIVDMNLPDGTGLEVIRQVKLNPVWSATPILVLSSQWDRHMVAEAYALGANCYLPKDKMGVDVIESLYDCWLKAAQLPAAPPGNLAEQIVGRSVSVKSQISALYTDLARTFSNDANSRLWINLALYESNCANLLAFFKASIRDQRIPSESLERLTRYIESWEARLLNVMALAKNRKRPSFDEALGWALDLQEPFDPQAFAIGFGILFPNGRAASEALAESTLNHLSKLVAMALSKTANPKIHTRARALEERLVAGRNAVAAYGPVSQD